MPQINLSVLERELDYQDSLPKPERQNYNNSLYQKLFENSVGKLRNLFLEIIYISGMRVADRINFGRGE